MSGIDKTLGEELFAVFARACQERDFELADYLLRGLEALARRENNPSYLDCAYVLFSDSLSADHEVQVHRDSAMDFSFGNECNGPPSPC